MAEWTSGASYEERTEHIGGAAGGLNAGYYLRVDQSGATVHDDNAHDVLTGSSGQDWFFANLFLNDDDAAETKDKITDLSAQEFANDLDFILSE